MKVLLVEDETKVAAFIKKGLSEMHHVVEVAPDGPTGYNFATGKDFDIIIIDIMLPGMNGIDLCKKIRDHNTGIPILMLTALDSIDDKVNGLSAGADDYLVKPFHFRELTARIQALTRRAGIQPPEDEVLSFKDLTLDTATKIANRAGREIVLTAKEYMLLEFFLRNRNKVLSRSYIAHNVWGIDFDSGTNVIDVYINYLRNKIEKGFDGKLIHTVIGMGYVLKDETA